MRSSWDRPLPSESATPVLSTPSFDSASVIAWAAPSKLAGLCRASATCRDSASASMLSDIDSACSNSREIGAECTVASVLAPAGAWPRTMFASGVPRASASAAPASRPG